MPFLLFFLSCGIPGFAQEKETKKETEKDSLEIYQKIEDFSEKTKLTRFLHNLVFRSAESTKRSRLVEHRERNYRPYEGKIIRKIEIQTLDPFGYSVEDSVSQPDNWIEATGNALHKKTFPGKIRDFLLIEKNEPLDILLLKESERLLRSQPYIRSALITASFPGDAGTKSDSVDVKVTVLDAWSIIPVGSFSTTRTSLGFRERNFIGTGHELGFRFTRHFDMGENAYDVRYTVPNFENTYIGANVGYSSYLDNSFFKGINIERVFYSPYTRWAGGVYVDQQLRKDSLPDIANNLSYESLRYNTYDAWGGHSFGIFKGGTENDRTTNLITSARILRVNYKDSPRQKYDPANFFSSETFYLGSIGISSRQFVKDQYIFHYGIIEDVPVGTVYGLTGGYQYKNNGQRTYLGARVAHGKYFSWGFISTNMEYGSFFRSGKAEQSTISFQANYFTNLISIGPEWKMRQFVKPQVVWGINRQNSIGDRITLNEYGNRLGEYGPKALELDEQGLEGFQSTLYGTKKVLLTLQTQFYSPWNVLGFRLNPFLKFSTALLGEENQNIMNSRTYSSIGAGFIISNDYLVFDVFQVSFAFFPEIPGRGSNIFRTNSFNTSDFGLQDFQFGKPLPVMYQ